MREQLSCVRVSKEITEQVSSNTLKEIAKKCLEHHEIAKMTADELIGIVIKEEAYEQI